LRFSLQTNLSILDFYRKLHRGRAIFLAELVGFLLHELLERFEASGRSFCFGLLAGLHHGLIERLHVVGFGLSIGPRDPERLLFTITDFVYFRVIAVLLEGPHTLDGEQGILRTPVTLLLDPEFLLPEAVENSELLLNGVELEALTEAHLATVAVLLEQGLNAPLEVGWRLLGASAEENVVLDLQAANVVIELIELFVYGQSDTRPMLPGGSFDPEYSTGNPTYKRGELHVGNATIDSSGTRQSCPLRLPPEQVSVHLSDYLWRILTRKKPGS
jgi:hypothetical protein